MKSGVCEVVKGSNGAIKMEDRVSKPEFRNGTNKT